MPSAWVTYTPDEDFEGTDFFYFVLKAGEWESAGRWLPFMALAPDLTVDACRAAVAQWTLPEGCRPVVSGIKIYRAATASTGAPTTLHATTRANRQQSRVWRFVDTDAPTRWLFADLHACGRLRCRSYLRITLFRLQAEPARPCQPTRLLRYEATPNPADH